MYRGSAVLLASAAGLLQGAAFGSEHAALLCALGVCLFGAVLFSLKPREQPAFLLFISGCFAIASNAVALRWLAGGLCAGQALGPALGALVAAVAILALSSTTFLSLWAAAVLCRRVRANALYALLLCSAQLLGDWVRELILPSFPWLSIGYTQADSPFAALLPLVGVEGAGFVLQFAALTAGALMASALSPGPGRRALFGCLVGVAACLAAAQVLVPRFSHDAAPLRVAIMQTSLSTREKFSGSGLNKRLTELVDFAQAHDARLIVTPETALPVPLDALDHDQVRYLQSGVSASRSVLFGTFSRDSRGETFNSAVLMQQPEGRAGVKRSTYIKRHLAPLGEYAPTGFRWLAGLLNLPFSDITATHDARVDFVVAGVTIVPSLCLDLLYGEDLRPNDARPHLLVNLSNPAFFSSPAARDQYLAIGRVRALETQSPLLLASNYGPSAVIDGAGAILESLPLGTAGALQLDIRPRVGATPYARWGDVFSLGLKLFALAVLFAAIVPRCFAKMKLLHMRGFPPNRAFQR